MSAKDRNEPGSITLHLNPDAVSASHFSQGVGAFLSLISAISEAVKNPDEKIKWSVRVEEGSNRFVVFPEGGLVSRGHARCISVIEGGLRMLDEQPRRPDKFADVALKQAKKLAQVVIAEGGYIGTEQAKIRITEDIPANIEKVLAVKYRDIGTVEGVLLLMSDVQSPQIGIREELTNKLIKCKFKQDELDEAAHYFHKRVSVRGSIVYGADGEIKRVEVEYFRPLGDANLPTIYDVRGILRDQ